LLWRAGFILVCAGYLLGAGLHWQGFNALGFLYLLSYLKLLASLIKCAISSVICLDVLIFYSEEEPYMYGLAQCCLVCRRSCQQQVC
jgi:O-antigen ligase